MKAMHLLLLTIISSALTLYAANEDEELKLLPPLSALFIQGITIDKYDWSLRRFVVDKKNTEYPEVKKLIEEKHSSVRASEKMIRDIQELNITYLISKYQWEHTNSHKTIGSMPPDSIGLISEMEYEEVPTEKTKVVEQEFEQITENTCLAGLSLDFPFFQKDIHDRLHKIIFISQSNLGEDVQRLNENIATIEYQKQERLPGVITKAALQKKENK